MVGGTVATEPRELRSVTDRIEIFSAVPLVPDVSMNSPERKASSCDEFHLAAAAQNVRQMAWPEPTPAQGDDRLAIDAHRKFRLGSSYAQQRLVVALLRACPRKLHSAPDLWDLPSVQEQRK